MTGHGPSLGGLLIRCGATGVIGAAFGVLVCFQHRGPLLTVGIALAATAFGALVAALIVELEPTAPARPFASQPPMRPPAATPPPARPRPVPPDPGGPVEPGRLLLPVEAVPQAAGWWNGGPTDRTVALTPAPSRPPAPDLATYRRPVRTVQCPRCGAFRIDVQETGGGYAFRCRIDDHTWTWRAGTGWPVTVVASRRRPER